ncbi:MAG: hypothetical protein IPK03_16525 [Bacteroidetes bacterium]|nr:hypothetical protein [Bacteroidota bacterium]
MFLNLSGYAGSPIGTKYEFLMGAEFDLLFMNIGERSYVYIPESQGTKISTYGMTRFWGDTRWIAGACFNINHFKYSWIPKPQSIGSQVEFDGGGINRYLGVFSLQWGDIIYKFSNFEINRPFHEFKISMTGSSSPTF